MHAELISLPAWSGLIFLTSYDLMIFLLRKPRTPSFKCRVQVLIQNRCGFFNFKGDIINPFKSLKTFAGYFFLVYLL